MNITEEEYAQLEAQAKCGRGLIPKEDEHEADPGPEEVLAGKIMKWAKDKYYPHQCFRKSIKAKGFLSKGFTD